jgi:hypothetical protein
MEEMLTDPDPARGQAAMKAMLGMKKIDLAAPSRRRPGLDLSLGNRASVALACSFT